MTNSLRASEVAATAGTHTTTTSEKLSRNLFVTVREACDLTFKSDKFFQRAFNPKDDRGVRFPNAYRDQANRGAWMIPVGDLVSAGLLDPSRLVGIEEELTASRESATVRELREQLVRLEERLAAAERRTEELTSDKADLGRLLEILASSRRIAEVA